MEVSEGLKLSTPKSLREKHLFVEESRKEHRRKTKKRQNLFVDMRKMYINLKDCM